MIEQYVRKTSISYDTIYDTIQKVTIRESIVGSIREVTCSEVSELQLNDGASWLYNLINLKSGMTFHTAYLSSFDEHVHRDMTHFTLTTRRLGGKHPKLVFE